MRLFLQAYSRPVNPHARAERIRIRDLMPHDHDLILSDDKLTQRLRLDTGFHAGILRSLLLLAAKISNAVAVFDDCLVPASRERQVDRHAGILVTEGVCGSIQTEPDTQSR